jgi:hypothetical protein
MPPLLPPLSNPRLLPLPPPRRAAEFLGFLNKTCEAGTKNGPSYGPTCGPTLRGASDGQRWKQWTVTVVGQDEDGNDLATIENFYPEGKGAPL